MHILRRYSFVLVTTIVFAGALVACDSGGGGGSDAPPPDEVRNTLQTASTDLSTNINADLMNGAFGSFAQSLFGDLQGGTTSTIAEMISKKNGHGELMIDALDQQDILVTYDGRLDYDASEKGEYNWDTDQWVSSGSSGDVILNFPSESQTSENNATFTLAEYSDTEVTMNGDSEYLPTQIDASIDTDGQGTIFSVDLGGTDSGPATYQLGQMVDVGVEILTAPLLHSFELMSPSATQFNFSFGLDNNETGNLVMGLSADVALNNDDYSDIEAEDVDEVSGNLDLSSEVSIAYALDTDDLAALGEDPSPQAINNEIENASILLNGEEAATLEYGTTTVNTGDGETEVETLLVVYGDGSEDPFVEVFGPLLGVAGNVDLNSMTESLPKIIQQ
jgi:hypothetical protein